jgi:hypothetical protein
MLLRAHGQRAHARARLWCVRKHAASRGTLATPAANGAQVHQNWTQAGTMHRTWSSEHSIAVGVKVTVTGGIPSWLGQGEVTIEGSFEDTTSTGEEHGVSTTVTQSVDITAALEPGVDRVRSPNRGHGAHAQVSAVIVVLLTDVLW